MKRALLVLAACHHHDAASCVRSIHVEMLLVDDGSAYMKQIYDRVGADGKGQPSDQDAVGAHITANLDTWTETAGPQHTDYYLTAPDRAALERYFAKQAPPPSDHHLVFEHHDNGHEPMWRSFYVSNGALIDDTLFAEVSPLPQETSRHERTGIHVGLSDRGRDLLGEVTALKTGHKMAVVVDGIVEMAAIIDGQIANGKLDILTSSLDEENRLAKGLCSLGE